MVDPHLRDKSILVVGGAGFVGSNLCQMLLEHNPRSVLIVDNLLSTDITNVPMRSNVRFFSGSITDDRILQSLPRDLEFVFHLARLPQLAAKTRVTY